jgi:hypothetical protein
MDRICRKEKSELGVMPRQKIDTKAETKNTVPIQWFLK